MTSWEHTLCLTDMMHNDYFIIYISVKHKRLIGRRSGFETVTDPSRQPCYRDSRQQTEGLMTFPESLGVSMYMIYDIVVLFFKSWNVQKTIFYNSTILLSRYVFPKRLTLRVTTTRNHTGRKQYKVLVKLWVQLDMSAATECKSQCLQSAKKRFFFVFPSPTTTIMRSQLINTL